MYTAPTGTETLKSYQHRSIDAKYQFIYVAPNSISGSYNLSGLKLKRFLTLSNAWKLASESDKLKTCQRMARDETKFFIGQFTPT